MRLIVWLKAVSLVTPQVNENSNLCTSSWENFVRVPLHWIRRVRSRNRIVHRSDLFITDISSRCSGFGTDENALYPIQCIVFVYYFFFCCRNWLYQANTPYIWQATFRRSETVHMKISNPLTFSSCSWSAGSYRCSPSTIPCHTGWELNILFASSTKESRCWRLAIVRDSCSNFCPVSPQKKLTL